MQPIGSEGNKKLTFAVDTEGRGLDVHVSGLINGTFGVQTIYFDTTRTDPGRVQTSVPISGIQEQELGWGNEMGEVKENIMQSIKNNRVLVHGGCDFSNLGINRSQLEVAQVELINTAGL